MSLTRLITLLKAELAKNGNRAVHAYNKDGDLAPITGASDLITARGDKIIERLWITTKESA